jgi:prepilin-type N-terminal cleavage/methylation domain-containing protein
MSNKKDKGFTLVELLIVIVILGILATVTVFAVRGITDKGQENSCQVEQRSIETAIEAHFADTGADPDGFVAPDPQPADTSYLVPDYLKDDPSARWSFDGSTTPATISAVDDGPCDVA